MKSTIVLISAFLALLLAIPMLPTAQATLYPYVVSTPSAMDGIGDGGVGWRYVTTGAKVILDGYQVLFYCPIYPLWIASGNFTINPWTYPPLPIMPDNATVLYVNLVAVVKSPSSSSAWFNLQYALNATYNDVWTNVADWYGPTNATWLDGPITYWKTCRVNVTDETVGGPTGGWSASMINSNDTWVRMYSNDYITYENAILVDYIGLEYVWQYEGGPGGPPPSGNVNIAPIDVPGIMGIFGFVGMIAVPAATIWFSRRDGGSKIYAAVMGFVAFFVCFGLFYASINGG